MQDTPPSAPGTLIPPATGLFSGPAAFPLLESRHRPPLQTLAAAIATVAASAVLATVLATALARLLEAGGSPLSQMSQLLAWLVAMQLGIVAGCVLAARAWSNEVARYLLLGWPPGGWGTIGRAFATMLAGVVVFNGVVLAVSPASLITDLVPFARMIRSEAWAIAATAVGMGAPLSEEVLFRGLLLPALAATRLGFRGAAVVSTLAWTGMHAGYTPLGLTEVMLVGLFLCWLVWRTGSLWVPLLCHGLYNSGLMVLLAVLPAEWLKV